MRVAIIGAAVLLVGGFLVSGMILMAVAMDDHMRFGRGGVDPEKETPAAGVTSIEIADFAYEPPNVRIPVGTTITWTNRDRAGHTVTSDEGDELDSPLLDRGESYQHTFSRPGRYAYHCRPHPYMKGLVTVE